MHTLHTASGREAGQLSHLLACVPVACWICLPAVRCRLHMQASICKHCALWCALSADGVCSRMAQAMPWLQLSLIMCSSPEQVPWSLP